jgi:hypothetical protein
LVPAALWIGFGFVAFSGTVVQYGLRELTLLDKESRIAELQQIENKIKADAERTKQREIDAASKAARERDEADRREKERLQEEARLQHEADARERQRKLKEEEERREADAREAERLRIIKEKEAQEKAERDAREAQEKAERDAKKAKEALHAEKKYGGYDDARAKAIAYRNVELDKYKLKYTDLPDNGITAERLDKSSRGREFWVFEGQITVEVNGKELTYTWVVMPQFIPSAGDRGLWRCKSSSISDQKGVRITD